jgi:hypothetical protein
VNLLRQKSTSSQPLEPEEDDKSQVTHLRDKKELFDHLAKDPKKQKLKEYEKIRAEKEVEGCTFKP